MSVAIFDTKKDASKYKAYLRRMYKTNLIIYPSKYDDEVNYVIPFPEMLD